LSTEATEHTEHEPVLATRSDQASPSKEQEHKPPSLKVVWGTILGIAVVWCLLPLWESLFLGGSAPGIYWLFIADALGLKLILVVIGAVALGEVIMVLALALGKPAETDAVRASREQMTVACGYGFVALLFLVARLGMAQLNFAPLLDQHMGRVETGQHIYFLAHEMSAGTAGDTYTFVQCEPLGIWCAQVAAIQTPPAPNSAAGPQAIVEYDSQLHSINVVQLGQTYYTDPLDR